MESGSVDMKWYVLQAYSGYENKVKQTLEDTIKREGLEKSFGEILVPTEEVLEIKEGQKKRTERKYFPGYVMIKMEMNDSTWHLVKSSPKVLGFVGNTGDKPIPLPANEAANLIQSMQKDADQPKPKVMFEPGEVVRITDGPFNDFNGVVEKVDFEKNRLKVSVLVFGKPTPIELSLTQVEKG
jgi:transcriptional antiterminator NusG